MPTPVGHSLIGWFLYYAFKPGKWRWSLGVLFLIAFISVLPDFDFLPGILEGQPNKYHHGISHSFGFALLLFVVAALIERYGFKRRKPLFSFWFFIFYSVHLIADYFSADTSFPYGEPLFWPLTGKYFISPVSIFSDIQREGTMARFFPSLFSRHNLEAVGIEIVVGLALFVGYFFLRWLLRKRQVLSE